MEIEIVKWFQSFSNSFLDVLNCGLTRFGEDIFFMCIFMMLYWRFINIFNNALQATEIT